MNRAKKGAPTIAVKYVVFCLKFFYIAKENDVLS